MTVSTIGGSWSGVLIASINCKRVFLYSNCIVSFLFSSNNLLCLSAKLLNSFRRTSHSCKTSIYSENIFYKITDLYDIFDDCYYMSDRVNQWRKFRE